MADAAREPKEPVLVSACLLGTRCRYDGLHNDDEVLREQLAAQGQVAVPFCPEEHGGLPTPRPAAWLAGGDAEAVLDGAATIETETRDVTTEFRAGAEGALEACRAQDIKRAYLKERSPSCGVCQTHVDGELRSGPGLTTALLRRHGIEVHGIEGRRKTQADD